MRKLKRQCEKRNMPKKRLIELHGRESQKGELEYGGIAQLRKLGRI